MSAPRDSIAAVPSVPGSAAFAALLARLRDDDDAGTGYETLRRRLIRFFRLHVPAEADELADTAIDRLARRAEEGIEIADVASYALGIARLVLLEARARHARHRLAEVDPTMGPAIEESGAEDERMLERRALSALDTCLGKLDAGARPMLLEYYAASGGERIRQRQRLAEQRGISLNALRNRALRLREALEECMRARLGGGELP